MLSGFETTRHIPPSCLALHTTISDEPLTSLALEIREELPQTEICALPGLTSASVMEWFELTPQWWNRPTVFWFGRSDQPFNPNVILSALKRMTSRMDAEWWVCAIPVTASEVERGDTAKVNETNALLQGFADCRFLDPIQAMGGRPVLPLEKRLDTFHPNCETNRAMAQWLISNTIGVSMSMTISSAGRASSAAGSRMQRE